jgi:hypothetical protein
LYLHLSSASTSLQHSQSLHPPSTGTSLFNVFEACISLGR